MYVFYVLVFGVVSTKIKHKCLLLLQFCTHHETSHKKNFPTFARTRPPDIQISKSVVSLLLAYNWTQVTFMYLESDETEIFTTVADTLMHTLRENGVLIRAVHTWNQVFHMGYMSNPFDQLVEKTYVDTRSEYVD